MKPENVKTRRHYVADRRQYLSNGKRHPTSGGWLTMYWDDDRHVYVEGCYHHTKAEALESLRLSAAGRQTKYEQ